MSAPRLLVCHPGARISTADVFSGLVAGLKAHGVDVVEYALHGRLEYASKLLHIAWRRKRKEVPNLAPPTFQDVCYQACVAIFEKLLRFKVDAVIIVSGVLVPRDTVQLIQSSLPVGIILTESPYLMDEERDLAQRADVVWTNERSIVDELRTIQPRSHYLPHAWLPGVHDTPTGDAPAHDVVFVGTGFSERVKLLEGVDWTGIDLGLYGNWRSVADDSPLKPFVKSHEIQNTQTTALYRKAKVGLNIYRTQAGLVEGQHIQHAESLNPRAYELAATGSFHLSTPRAEVAEVFGPTVPTFQTSQELESLLRYWLSHDAERQAMAARLPALVAEDTWIARGGQVLNELRAVTRTRAA
jgi:spore maturation protein CgeB